MIPAVVSHGVTDRRRAVAGYGIGLALMILWVMAVYPSVERELADYVEAMPESMKSLFGIEDLNSLAGFLHAEIFSLVGPLVFLTLAITSGAATLAGEEHDGVLAIVIATGVGRGPLLRSKLVALAIEVLALGLATWVAVMLGTLIAGGGIGMAGATAATVQLACLGLLFGTLAVTAGAATGRKGLAAATATGVALVSYLVDALANLVGWLEPAQVLSPFHWYAPGDPLVDGFSMGGLILLVGCTAALAIAAVTAFDRRDLRT